MQVWVVTKQTDKGVIAGVFDTLKGASEYIAEHPYSAYSIEECKVRTEAKSNA